MNLLTKPFFLITLDTEGDNIWSNPKFVTTKNSEFVSRFQALCERYGFKPTYFVNYEMATCPRFIEFGRDVIKRRTAEIGLHIHAWHSPPEYDLTGNDSTAHPYLIEYPDEIIRSKVSFMLDLLRETFQVEIRSHRAGRWMINDRYARILMEHGIEVDCSVTPFIDWREINPNRKSGIDYTSNSSEPYYYLDEQSEINAIPLLEVPMTICKVGWRPVDLIRKKFPYGTFPRRVLDRFFPGIAWLRPNRWNSSYLKWIVREIDRKKLMYAQFMLHTSELMPGGSPTFRNVREIEQLYDNLIRLFELVRGRFIGSSVIEFSDWYRKHHNTISGG